MFESLSEKLSGILDKLTGRGALSEEDVNAAMREVRRALLEADVALEVVRTFVDSARTKAVGADGHQVGHARPDGRQDRPRRADRDARRRTPSTIDLNAPRAGRHHDGRPAGRGQDHHRPPRSPSG